MIELWYQALHAYVGIEVETDNLEGLRQQLYASRRSALDPQLDTLALVVSPFDPNRLWIIHKTVKK